MAMSELKWRLLLLELVKSGYREAWYSDTNGIVYTDPADKRMPKIHDNGDIVYGTEYDHLVVSDIQPIVDKVNEQVAAWEKSQPISFNDTSKFRIIAEYNNVVLAARDDGNIGHGLHFTTWAYNLDRTGFDDGHYTEDYEAAKEDFAVRAGIINRYKMFSETELKLIRQGLVYLGANYPDLTTEQMTNVGKLIEKVEIIVPSIQKHEELEHNEIVPDDGLEI